MTSIQFDALFAVLDNIVTAIYFLAATQAALYWWRWTVGTHKSETEN